MTIVLNEAMVVDIGGKRKEVPRKWARLYEEIRASSVNAEQLFGGVSLSRMNVRVNPDGKYLFTTQVVREMISYKLGWLGSANFMHGVRELCELGFLRQICMHTYEVL